MALAVAGCGGDATRTAGVGPRLNRICADLAARERKVEPNGFGELATKGPLLLRELDRAILEVTALSRRWRSSQTELFVSQSLELRGVLAGIYGAAKRDDVARAAELGAEADRLNRESNDLARRLGAPACSG